MVQNRTLTRPVCTGKTGRFGSVFKTLVTRLSTLVKINDTYAVRLLIEFKNDLDVVVSLGRSTLPCSTPAHCVWLRWILAHLYYDATILLTSW